MSLLAPFVSSLIVIGAGGLLAIAAVLALYIECRPVRPREYYGVVVSARELFQ